MRLTNSVKPVSYVKAHAAEIIRDVSERQEPMVITVNGEAKAVLVDVATWDRTQETLAMLTLLAQSQRSIERGDTAPLDEAFARIRAQLKVP